MKLSKLGLRTEKNRADEDNLSMDIAFQGNLMKRYSSGIYGLGNFLTKSRNKVVEIIREELEKNDCVEVSLPIMQPKQLWEESGRWQKYIDSKEMFHFLGRNGEYCIAPTAEEVVFEFVKNNITSYKNLNINIFQFGFKFRDEIRARGGLLRSKEFLMKDGYSFSSSFQEMEIEYEKMKQCYINIFKRLGLDILPVRAVNGSIGGKRSEEFMFISDIGGDKCLYNQEKNIALNTEILEDEVIFNAFKNDYGEFDLKDFKEVKSIELGHIFQLEQNYSKSMNGKFTTKDGEMDYFYMGCYGIGVNRTLGAILEKNCDEEGLYFPQIIAPYNLEIVNLFDSELNIVAENLYKKLLDEKIEVLWDDRDLPFGQKIKDAMLFGMPKIVIIGNKYKESNLIEVEDRKTKEKQLMNLDDLIKLLKL